MTTTQKVELVDAVRLLAGKIESIEDFLGVVLKEKEELVQENERLRESTVSHRARRTIDSIESLTDRLTQRRSRRDTGLIAEALAQCVLEGL